MASGHAQEALTEFRKSSNPDSGGIEGRGTSRPDFRMARAFDRAEISDSAIVYFEDVVSRLRPISILFAALPMPLSLRRLGELYEAKGDIPKSLKYYQEFVKLWQNADPELQPQVAEIRGRVARLLAAEARKR
jgi:hypothetical protein